MRTVRQVHLVLAAMLAILLVRADVSIGQQGPDPRVRDLAAVGKIRAGLFLPQYTKDSATGEPRSAWVELFRALAARLGTELVIVESSTPPQTYDCFKSGACDFFISPRDARTLALGGDFSHPAFETDFTFLVPTGSAIQSVADADRPGIRIAAVRSHGSSAALVRRIKQAKIVYAETPELTFDLLRSGQADAIASNRYSLLDYADRLPGSRVLPDRFGWLAQRIVLPKDHAGWRAYLDEFIEDAKTSGLLQRCVERGGTRGISVAPAGDAD